jgi:tetratricopeptide (TPR) repeat protein
MIFLDDDTGHYYHHPIVRSYAYGLLRRDAAFHHQVLDRYVDHVIETVAEVLKQPPEEWTEMELYGPHLQQVGALLLEETTNAADELRAETLERARAFGHTVREYAIQRPELGDIGMTWLRMGLDAARALDDAPGTLALLRSMGEWHERRDAAVAERYDEEALELARKLGDRGAEAAVLSHYGELQRTQGRADKAIEILGQALDIHRETKDARMEAVTLKYLGETYWRKGNFEKAQELQEMALAIFEKLGNTSGVGDIYNKIGSINFAAGDHRAAVGYFQKALAIHEKVGNKSMAAEDLNDMGAARKYLGELDEAMELLSSALDIHEEVGNRRLQAMTKANISSIHLLQGRVDDGVRVATEALDVAREAKAAVAETWALNWLGVASEEREAYGDARKHFESALECSRRAENPRGEAGVLGNLGRLLAQKLGEPKEGLALLEQGRDVMEANDLSQAFGGRRLDDFRELIREIQAMLS